MTKRFYDSMNGELTLTKEDVIDYGSASVPIEPIPVLAPFKVNLSLEVYQKMLAYARASQGEVSGFGKSRRLITPEKIRTYEIQNVTIFKQIVTPAHTELDQEALVQFYMDLIKQGERPERWNLWWHSHNDFNVFFSGEDVNTIETLSKETNLISICINKKGEMVGRFDRRGKCLSDTSDTIIDIITPGFENILLQCQKEVKRKVRYRAYTAIKGEKADEIYEHGLYQASRPDIYRPAD